MGDSPSLNIDLAVGGTPAGAASAVSLDVVVSGVLPLPAVRLEVDELTAGLELVLVHDDNGFRLVPKFTGVHGPSTVQISIDLPGVTGGGELAVDETGQWRGAVTLMFGALKVSGYALLSPKSLLIVLSARFPAPGIQVGFGFAVTGVGGIFGVNRRTDTLAITAAVKDGSLGNLLFPADPEHDIPAVLANLPAMFPRQDGQALFGPMLEITWGGGLLKAQVALIVEAPAPVRVSLLGRLIVDLPAGDVALVHIQATFAATVDTGVPEFRLIASLTGSHIVGIALTGDLFLLIRGGSDATFVLSVGGFHPAVHPPAGVPALQRVGMSMSLSVAELRYESYFAVTTCSVQFGAKAELTASVADCGLHGWFGFDALIEWVPRFHFRVDITAGVEVEVFGETLLGVRLSGVLEGPAPWHIRAHGEVEVLLVSVSITIDESFGDAPSPITKAPDVTAELVAALRDPTAWSLHPPDADTDGVVLSAAAAAAVAHGVLLHPAGRLQVRQRLLPFGLDIDRFGGAAVSRQCWQLTGVRLRADAAPSPFTDTVSDQFAMGMFRTMTADEQLSSTSFSEQPSGAVITPSGVARGPVASIDGDWDTVVVGPDLNTASLVQLISAFPDISVYVPARGRPIDMPWTVATPVTVQTEPPMAVVPDATVVGIVPTPLTATITTQAAATDKARRFSMHGTKATVVEQWELS